MSAVIAPVDGRVIALADVADPVFSAEMVGPGCAIEPAGSEEMDAELDVVSPVSGTLVKLHPHAFVITTAEGVGVLVHLGIDTVQLKGEGFDTHVAEGDEVSAGQLVTRWTTWPAAREGYPATVMIAVLDREPGSIVSPRVGDDVAKGEELFTL